MHTNPTESKGVRVYQVEFGNMKQFSDLVWLQFWEGDSFWHPMVKMYTLCPSCLTAARIQVEMIEDRKVLPKGVSFILVSTGGLGCWLPRSKTFKRDMARALQSSLPCTWTQKREEKVWRAWCLGSRLWCVTKSFSQNDDFLTDFFRIFWNNCYCV